MFTTKQKIVKEVVKLFPGETVLIQHGYISNEDAKVNTKFTLNEDSMIAFGMTPNTATLNNITWGIDDEGGYLMLANLKGDDSKTSVITKANTFSNQKLLDKLVKEFEINPSEEHVFTLNIFEEGGLKVSDLGLRSEKTTEDSVQMEGPYENYDEEISKIYNESVEQPKQSFEEYVGERPEEVNKPDMF